MTCASPSPSAGLVLQACEDRAPGMIQVFCLEPRIPQTWGRGQGCGLIASLSPVAVLRASQGLRSSQYCCKGTPDQGFRLHGGLSCMRASRCRLLLLLLLLLLILLLSLKHKAL